ncbi:hypothetical protein PDESU_06173 [Pontiella desulfatans]|uniref:Uncharacterized protein n=1 Tax=Pontiella desulfatans TaxID=2750659 RepID=A0A6C2UBZ2_PONDE|nr:hypothetical protein [Pontiella desulfatans]VGO17575.1 hypothetical protein PDESU_06173 [Pontiella desulfatans]
MPNWVYNELYITGHEKARKALCRQAKGTYTERGGKVRKSPFMFSRFCPPPPYELLEGIYALEKDDDWPLDMKWQSDNWGCKWDVAGRSDLLRVTKSSHVYSLLTAWAPPSAFIRNLSCLYPYLHFSLHSTYPAGGRGIEKFVGGYSNYSCMYKSKLSNVGKLP